MLISKQRGFVFVHVQKTGGTSLQQVLKSHVPDARKWHGKHGHAKDGIADIGRERWDRLFSFGFVRNPWDRLVSWYSMIQDRIEKLSPEERRQPRPFKYDIWNYALRCSHDFDSFLENCTAVIYDRGCYKSFAFNQIDYLSDEGGAIAVDFIGRHENFAEDAAQALRRIGIEAEIPRLNPSRRGGYRDYYTPRTRALVERRFARDIAAFGYEF